jgi:hypothetical protein
MQKNTKLKTGIMVGVLALGAAILPSVVSAANPATDTGTTTVNVSVGSVITLGNGTTDVNIAPTVGQTGTAVQTLTVTTNSSSGYQLKIAMNSASTSLVSGANNITATTNGTTAGLLQNNTWGYNYSTSNVAASDFLSIPSQGSPVTIASSTTTASAVPTYVTFGALPTASLPTGTYAGSVLYTAVTNP